MWDAASHRSSRLKRLCNKQSALLVPHPNRPEAESRMGASDDPNLLTNKDSHSSDARVASSKMRRSEN